MSRHQLSDEEPDSHVPLLTDHDHNFTALNDHNYSPAASTTSVQSHEVKYIFEPCAAQADREADTYSDYSHVNIRPKGTRYSETAFSGRPPPYSRHDANSSARLHYNLQAGVAPGGVQRFRFQPQTASLEDVSGYEASRRKSWSPQLSQQSAQGYPAAQNNRSCYSSNMVDWETLQKGMAAYERQAYPQGHPQPQGHHFQGYPEGPPQFHVPNYSQGQEGQISSDAECLPPRLAPVSGVLSEKLSRNLIRPIAFKPAYARLRLSVCKHCGNEPSVCGCQSHGASRSHSQPSGPESFHPQSPSVRSANASQLSLNITADNSNNRSVGYSRESTFVPNDSPGVNVDQSPSKKATTTGSDGVTQTPSPSDSGVGELEAMLKEREAEILTLRQVMDRNERAIFQVYEEKKHQWLQDMREIREEYERKLRHQQQKASRLEQNLSVQVRRLQLEKQQIQGKVTNLQAEKDAAAAIAKHGQGQGDAGSAESDSAANTSAALSSSSLSTPPKRTSTSSLQSGGVGGGGDESGLDPALQEEVAMKNTEIIALRAQLSSLQLTLDDRDQQLSHALGQLDASTHDLASLHEQLDQLSAVDRASLCQQATQTCLADLAGPSLLPAAPATVIRPECVSDEDYIVSLERQVSCLHEQLQGAEAMVEAERMQWLEEKNKVIRYQKQLQLNYVQMQRKNTILEAEVEQLTLELESRDLKLVALNGEESVC